MTRDLNVYPFLNKSDFVRQTQLNNIDEGRNMIPLYIIRALHNTYYRR